MELTEKLARLLDERHWNATDLQSAVLPDVSRSTVSNWVNGVYKLPLAAALRIARAFDVSLEYLADPTMDVDSPRARPPGGDGLTEDERTIVKVYRACVMRGMGCEDVIYRMTWDGDRGAGGCDGAGGGGEGGGTPPPGLAGDAGVRTTITDRDRSGDRPRDPEASGSGLDLDVEDVPPVEVSPPARPRRRK